MARVQVCPLVITASTSPVPVSNQGWQDGCFDE
jgi:hypothetical protein